VPRKVWDGWINPKGCSDGGSEPSHGVTINLPAYPAPGPASYRNVLRRYDVPRPSHATARQLSPEREPNRRIDGGYARKLRHYLNRDFHVPHVRLRKGLRDRCEILPDRVPDVFERLGFGRALGPASRVIRGKRPGSLLPTQAKRLCSAKSCHFYSNEGAWDIRGAPSSGSSRVPPSGSCGRGPGRDSSENQERNEARHCNRTAPRG